MDNLVIKEGVSYTSEMVVTSDKTAKELGSGNLDVLGTPAMIALMENAANNAVSPLFVDGYDSVGVDILAVHSKPTAVGDTVTATATLTKVDGRKLTFDVVASDSEGEIGRGIHNRFIVEVEKFMSKISKAE